MSRWSLVPARRVAGGLAAVWLIAVVAHGVPAMAGTSQPPSVFDVREMGAPILTNVSLTAAVPLLVTAGLGVSTSDMNSQPYIQSEAAPVYSPLVEDAGLLGLPPLPAYPWCYSYYPGIPSRSSCGGQSPDLGGLQVGAASGTTSSNGSQSDPSQLTTAASTAVQEASVGAGSSVLVTVGHAESATTAGPHAGGIAAGASADLGNVDVAGVLRIASISSIVSGSLTGEPGGGQDTAKMEVLGATIAGQSVSIDASGAHVLGQSLGGALASAQGQVNQALAAAGLTVRALPASTAQLASDGTALDLSSGAVELTFLNASQGIKVQLLLGQSTLSLHASVPPTSSSSVGASPPSSAAALPLNNETGMASGGGGSEAATAPPLIAAGAASPRQSAFSSATGSGGAPPAPVAGQGAGAPQRIPFLRTSLPSHEANWKHIYLMLLLLAMVLPVAATGSRITLRRQAWKTIS